MRSLSRSCLLAVSLVISPLSFADDHILQKAYFVHLMKAVAYFTNEALTESGQTRSSLAQTYAATILAFQDVRNPDFDSSDFTRRFGIGVFDFDSGFFNTFVPLINSALSIEDPQQRESKLNEVLFGSGANTALEALYPLSVGRSSFVGIQRGQFNITRRQSSQPTEGDRVDVTFDLNIPASGDLKRYFKHIMKPFLKRHFRRADAQDLVAPPQDTIMQVQIAENIIDSPELRAFIDNLNQNEQSTHIALNDECVVITPADVMTQIAFVLPLNRDSSSRLTSIRTRINQIAGIAAPPDHIYPPHIVMRRIGITDTGGGMLRLIFNTRSSGEGDAYGYCNRGGNDDRDTDLLTNFRLVSHMINAAPTFPTHLQKLTLNIKQALGEEKKQPSATADSSFQPADFPAAFTPFCVMAIRYSDWAH